MNQSEVKLINSIKVSHLVPKELSIHIVYYMCVWARARARARTHTHTHTQLVCVYVCVCLYIYISCIELFIKLQISLQIANIVPHLRG